MLIKMYNVLDQVVQKDVRKKGPQLLNHVVFMLAV